MQQKLFFLIIFLHCLLIKSVKLLNTAGQIDLIFCYSSIKSGESSKLSIRTHLVNKIEVDYIYVLQGNQIGDELFVVTTIKCNFWRYSNGLCPINFRSKYLSLQNRMSPTQYVLQMDEDYAYFKQLLRSLSSQMLNNKKEFNLTYIISRSSIHDGIDKPKDLNGNSLSTTSLIGIIFLSVCAVIVFGFTIVWFAILHYRRFTQNRMEKNQRKALAKSTQEILDKSPIITFDANSEHNDYTDRDPMCAICLESFKNKEKLRKLGMYENKFIQFYLSVYLFILFDFFLTEICSHYFHITCIDPWLLLHQSCPLCNRNILHNSIPSISSNVMISETEQQNYEILATVNNNNNN
ncbi:unnamed protein product [Rotaria sp. Silwood2]|nr:unnamed protein product [Rotaria sp. Silwood2]